MNSLGFKTLFDLIEKGFILLLILLPLAIWKLIEIIIWLLNHIKII